MTRARKWAARLAGPWMFTVGEPAAAVAVVVVLTGTGWLVVWAPVPWWVPALAAAAPVGAVARLSRDARRLGLQYLAWRSGLIGRWRSESNAKRMTTDIDSEAGDGGGRGRGGGESREGRNVLSGLSRNGRRSGRLSRADTKDSEDRKRLGGRWVARPEEDRFLENVQVTGGCHLWTGKLTEDGYPLFLVKRDGEWVWVRAHRWAWEQEYGPLPPGQTLDHVRERGCDHHHCVFLEHLEPVTQVENRRRQAEWSRRQARTAEDTPEDNGQRESA